MQERYGVSVQRSCGLALLRRSVWYAKSQARDQSALRLRIREIAMDRPRFGYLELDLPRLRFFNASVQRVEIAHPSHGGDTTT
ncbi:MAG: hypothetical protein RIS34_122 [Pseudomonadota bacterium]|jgi:hypothetical protein